MTAGVHVSQTPASAEPPAVRAPRVTARRVTAVLGHAYIWFCLFVFVLPFAALLFRSFAEYGGSSGLENFQYVIGTSRRTSSGASRITGPRPRDRPRGQPARRRTRSFGTPFPGKRIIFSILQLPLYVPGAVIGLALLLTYTFTYHAVSMWGLVLAMAVGTFPLMLTPIVVALKDLPPEFEEAARCLGATGWQTYRKVVFPLIGPGVSAGLLLCFIIVFNEYLVTLFVHPVDIETAPLRIFNLQKTGGLSPATAALAVTMQLVSFAAVLVFFRVFGTRHFKGTYIL